ncbi:MAG: hypothetical protein MUC50_02595 [Myxococcota bacterium]|jgi:hypothetical protein|nr:hypothetical protein [Myxococcota bacterium]
MKTLRRITLIIGALAALPACQDKIGDSCSFDADCSPNMDRNCDRSQPGGYCLIIGCEAGQCPRDDNGDEDWVSLCVEFTTPCPVDETGAVQDEEACQTLESTRARSYCLRRCRLDGSYGIPDPDDIDSDTESRGSGCRKGYWCAKAQDVYGVLLDEASQRTGICVPKAEAGR